MNRVKLVTALAAGVIASASAIGAPVTSSGPIDIGFDINFFGNTYSQLYVYNNGSISFSGGQAVYTGSSMPNMQLAPDPFISPLTFDTDSHKVGWAVSNGSGTADYNYKDNGAYEMMTYWLGTWMVDPPGDTNPNGRNLSTLMIVDRSDVKVGDFDFVFIFYSGDWDGTNVFDASFFGYGAQGNLYGYTTDSDHLLTLNASQLPYHSINSGRVGHYVFEVRDGVVTNPLPFLTTVVPEPETWAMMLAGLGLMAGIARRRQVKR
jgi:hypothetical protein